MAAAKPSDKAVASKLTVSLYGSTRTRRTGTPARERKSTAGAAADSLLDLRRRFAAAGKAGQAREQTSEHTCKNNNSIKD